MSKILVIGGSSFDRVAYVEKNPSLYGTTDAKAYIESAGSSGTAKALALTKLGESVHFHTVLGDDEAGKKVRDFIEKNGISLSYDLDPMGTNLKLKIIDDSGNKISIHLPHFDNPITLSRDVIKKLMKECDVIVLNLVGYNRDILDLVGASERPVWCDLHDYLENDPHYDAFIKVSDYIFMSSDRLMGYRETMKALGNTGKLVVCTHGKGGSTAYYKDRFYEQSAYDFVPVDSTGAGDSFFSGFLSEYLKKGNIERSLMYASIAGGLSIETREIVDKYLSHELVEKTLLSKGIFDKSYPHG